MLRQAGAIGTEPDGVELALAYWTMAATLALTGGGRFSIDAALLSHFGRGGGGGGGKL